MGAQGGAGMKVWVLMENQACGPEFVSEHGLSLYIETGDLHILFDAGQSGAFADNAERLGVDLSRADFAVLSHGHYDHGGGLARFMDCNDHAAIYVSRHAFGAYYNAAGKYIGLPPKLAESTRLVYVDKGICLAPGIELYSQIVLPPARTDGLKRLEQGRYLDEDFRHEQYLVITEQGRRICISGCAHRGVVGIAQYFRPDVLIGGFHFKGIDPESPELAHAINALMELPTVYYTGHCTGEMQYHRMKKIMGGQLMNFRTGMILDI